MTSYDRDPPPEPPAAAFFEMRSVLPERYFFDGPPTEGILMTVIGLDRVRTDWRMPEELAKAIAPVLTSRPVRVKQKRFDDRNR